LARHRRLRRTRRTPPSNAVPGQTARVSLDGSVWQDLSAVLGEAAPALSPPTPPEYGLAEARDRAHLVRTWGAGALPEGHATVYVLLAYATYPGVELRVTLGGRETALHPRLPGHTYYAFFPVPDDWDRVLWVVGHIALVREIGLVGGPDPACFAAMAAIHDALPVWVELHL